MMQVAGGCQCGAVRYTATAASDKAYWCHCRMCQRALGNAAAAFVNVAKADLAITGNPAHFMSSPFGRRGFCGTCGTPLTFDYIDSDRIDLTLGSLDAPQDFVPTSHFGVESRHPAWIAPDSLPETRADDYPPLVARWTKAKGQTA